jgi:glycine reductase
MRLELLVHHVRDLRWGDATALRAGVLSVDRAALTAHLLEDPRLAGVDLALVHPGESCRVGPIFDVVEPRARGDGGVDFPGALGPIASVGAGSTTSLRGIAVTMLDPAPRGPFTSVVDFVPPATPLPGADQPLSRYSALRHLVVVPDLADGIDALAGLHALRLAVLRAAVYLARAVGDAPPDAVEVFTLAPVAPDLPRVAYLYQIHSHQRPTAPGEPLVYGDNARHLLPTVVHPNEVLDGAVLPAYGSHGIQTHGVQNHPVVLELYGRHGRDLAFAGVVLTVAHNTAAERDRTVAIASNLARFALRADGVVLTKSGGGAPHVDMAELAHRCEQLGLATCLIAWDSSGTGSRDDGGALFNYPDLNAIVNFGNGDVPVALPAVERVVTLAADPAARERLRGPLTARVNFVCGAMDQIGGGHLVASIE